MELKNILAKIINLIKKYRYAVLILVIGLVLMSVPSFGTDTVPVDSEDIQRPEKELQMEEKLSEILSQVSGAGKVQVILTVAAGEEVIYQTDDDATKSADSSATNTDTVTVTDADRNQSGLIRQVNPAVYLGAIIVCEGADNPTVHLAIVDAVSKATGLGTNRISVLKMK